MAVVFSYSGNEALAEKICENKGFEVGEVVWRHFPDSETYVRVISPVKNKTVIIVCSLNNPDKKIMSLLFFSKICKEHGASKIILIAPYLSYMRQDKIFNEGEGITSKYFANLLSENFDSLITIDPHAHRLALKDLYTVPSTVVHAAPAIAKWIKHNAKDVLLIGPDVESKQWIEPIAKLIDQPYVVATKKRISDTEVKLNVPDLSSYMDRTAVIIDDIISSGGTLLKLVEHLHKHNINSIQSIVIHPLFSKQTEDQLINAGIEKLVSCTTIEHRTNAIDISQLIIDSL